MAAFRNPHSSTARFAMGSDSCILADEHLWIHHRDTVARPGLGDVGGIAGFYFPPAAGPTTRISLELNGRVWPADSYEWRPGEFVREAKADGLDVSSLLVVLPGGGFELEVQIENRSSSSRKVVFCRRVDASFAEVEAAAWGWVPPKPEGHSPSVPANGAGLSFAAADGSGWLLQVLTDEGISGELKVAAGSKETLRLAARISRGDVLPPDRADVADARALMAEGLRAHCSAFPRMRTSHTGLLSFYDRSVFSLHTCLWDSEAFALRPHLAESGIDGGAICTYHWGVAYISKLLALSMPELLRAQIVQALRSNPFEHYAFTPIDGVPIGPWYSYNQFSLVWAIFQYVVVSGDIGFLRQEVDGKTVYEWAFANAAFLDDLEKPVRLLDYGDDHNLLELRRTDAYRHTVPSPNGERCFCYEAVDRLARMAGLPVPGLAKRAAELARLVVDELWDEEHAWFRTIDTEGRGKICWSIQVFDLLRFGILDDAKRAALCRHLNEKEFLSDYGVHSLSKLDPGYDESDVDWGGPGVYAGDGPELVEDLYLAGRMREGDDLLERLLWWGLRMPYYPQAVRADAIDYRRDGRANVNTGLKAAEVVLFGLLGLSISADGLVTIQPHLPDFVDDFVFEGVSVRGRAFDVSVSGTGYDVRSADGIVERRLGEATQIPS